MLTLISALALAGTVDGNALKAVVKKNHEKIMACYEPEAKQDPKLSGDVIVNFLLAEDGSAKNVRIKKSDLKNKNVETCIAKVFAGLTFPKPQGGTIDVNYPLSFGPVEVIEEVKQAPPKKPGQLPQGAIRDTIGAQKNAFQGCFEKEKKKAGNISGKVSTEFMVELDGTVSSATVKETTLKNATVEGCVVEELKKLRFPKPEGETGVRVSFPFNFQ